MSNWLVAIVGGAIATVIGGVVLFYLLPSTQAPGLSLQSIGSSSPRHLKCTMVGGPMKGRVHSMTIDTVQKKVWTDKDGDFLQILSFDEQRISVRTVLPYSGLPEHDHVTFDVHRISLAVNAYLLRKRTPEELSKCRSESGFREGDIDFCAIPVLVGEPSQGQCREVARAL